MWKHLNHLHSASLKLVSALDDDEELSKMHITLALNYDKADSVTLSTLFSRFENVDASSWELRLYSRDIRIGSKQVDGSRFSKSFRHSPEEFVKIRNWFFFQNFVGFKSDAQLPCTSL